MFLHIAEKDRVTKANEETFRYAKCAVYAQKEHEKEEPGPMLSAGEGAQCDGPATKDKTKARDFQIRNIGVFKDGQVPESGCNQKRRWNVSSRELLVTTWHLFWRLTEYSKSRNEGEEGV